MSVYEMSVDKMPTDEMSVDEMSIDEMANWLVRSVLRPGCILKDYDRSNCW